MEIGYKLKNERQKRNWTQEEVAKKLNVSRSTISSWEVGRTYPDLDALVAISDLYEVSLDILLREDTTVVTKISKDAKKGRNRKWLVAVLVILLPLGFYLGTKFKQTTFYSISVEDVKQADVTTKDSELSKSSIVNLTVDFPDGQQYKGYSPQIQDETLYLTIWSGLGKSKETAITIPLSAFENKELEQVSEIVIVQDDKNSENDFSDSPQKIIWTQ